jgi:CRP/FNR family cyclic AMP-dependent transcriptional regulator
MQLERLHTNPEELFSAVPLRRSTVAKSRGERLYSQGDDADAVFYLHRGYLKLTVLSGHGKQAVIGILGPRSFLGYGCLSGQRVRESTVTSISECTLTRIDQSEMRRLLAEETRVQQLFVSYVLARNARLEADLAEHLFNPCEIRLAHVLERLAAIERANGSEALLSNIDQQTLAGMVGTTQPRISVLLGRWRKKGCKLPIRSRNPVADCVTGQGQYVKV